MAQMNSLKRLGVHSRLLPFLPLAGRKAVQINPGIKRPCIFSPDSGVLAKAKVISSMSVKVKIFSRNLDFPE